VAEFLATEIKTAFDRIRASGMNEWVGGADPEETGDACAAILLRHMPVVYDTRLLDLGAGVGRVTLGLLRQRPLVKAITGIDIVPRMVKFCNETIAPVFPNTNFELLADANIHYDRFKDATPPRSRADLTAQYGGTFDCAYAFSVFTHIDVNDFASLLEFAGGLIKPGGFFLFTAFALTPYSRAMIAEQRTAGGAFPQPQFYEDGDVFVGNAADRLAFIAYDVARIEAMIWEAGLAPTAIEYGDWRGGGLSLSLQDIFVCRKPFTGASG
jgi:SAM-dependent methyltransferase